MDPVLPHVEWLHNQLTEILRLFLQPANKTLPEQILDHPSVLLERLKTKLVGFSTSWFPQLLTCVRLSSKLNLPKSDNFQVVRYSALFAGVVYGWYRHRSLQATHNEHKLRDATHHREHLIVQAKEAWKRKQDSAKGVALITDPENSSFDLEKLLLHLEKTS